MTSKIFRDDEIVVQLPHSFNLESMRWFIKNAVDAQKGSGVDRLVFDFIPLRFIEPEGVVVLSNTIEYFKQSRVRVFFRGHNFATPPIRYLDDSGFFKKYLGEGMFIGGGPRGTTVPLEFFCGTSYISYLYRSLVPWIGNSVNLSEDTLATIRASLEEVFHNVEYHSGVNSGCVFAQHFPKAKKICIAISDFGIGIPNRVRTVMPEVSESEALRLAVREGFTTKTNVRNRGVGLSTLIKYITQRNGGTVLIHSDRGYLSATQGADAPNITSRQMEWVYPGTLVHVVLRTDTLERLENDVAPEVFQWQQSA